MGQLMEYEKQLREQHLLPHISICSRWENEFSSAPEWKQFAKPELGSPGSIYPELPPLYSDLPADAEGKKYVTFFFIK
jgi:hypothetical protein